MQPAGIVTDGHVALVAFDATTHEVLLRDWLCRPHVARWFGAAEAQIVPYPGSGHSVIAVNGTPSGYVRWRRVSREALDDLGLHDIPAGSIDMDIFLADAAATGKGIGPAALTLLTASLDAPAFGLTTELANEIAQRAFAKAGFVKHCQYDAPGFGRCWLMVKSRKNVLF